MSAKASTGYPSYRWISSVPFVVFLNDSLPNTTAVISGSGYIEAISKPTFLCWILTAVALISGRQGAAYGALTSRKRRAKEEKEKKRVKCNR